MLELIVLDRGQFHMEKKAREKIEGIQLEGSIPLR